jgi:hypothetical protein
VWIFFIFWSTKIRGGPTGVISSLSPPWCFLSSGRCRYATAPCQDELDVSALSSSNTLFLCLPSQAETEAFNMHHHPTPLSTAIKKSSQYWSLSPPLNRVSILPPPYPEHHAIRAPPAVVVPFYHCLTSIVPPHNDTPGDELTNPLWLSKQLIDMWIHIKRYFEMSQHRTEL